MRAARPSAASVLAVAGVLLGSGVLGFLVHRLTAPRGAVRAAPAEAGAPGAQGAFSPSNPAPAPVALRSIPERLPSFSLPDLAGKPRPLSDFEGRPLIVNFWATWCEPCRREIPLLKEIRRENSRNNLEIVGIAIDQADSVQKFVRQLGIDYPILVGEKGGLEAVSAFGMDTVLPFTVFADAEGRIVWLKTGELHRDEVSFILARLADIRAGRLDLASARRQIGDETRRLSAFR